MKGALAFAAGFAAGWVARSTIDSSKSASVQLVAYALESMARVKRAVAIELERVEDLVAEARQVAARRRARPAGASGSSSSANRPAEHAA